MTVYPIAVVTQNPPYLRFLPEPTVTTIPIHITVQSGRLEEDT